MGESCPFEEPSGLQLALERGMKGSVSPFGDSSTPFQAEFEHGFSDGRDFRCERAELRLSGTGFKAVSGGSTEPCSNCKRRRKSEERGAAPSHGDEATAWADRAEGAGKVG